MGGQEGKEAVFDRPTTQRKKQSKAVWQKENRSEVLMENTMDNMTNHLEQESQQDNKIIKV